MSKAHDQLKPFVESEILQEFIQKAQAIGPKENFPYQNYFALNFKNDQLDKFKVYFSYFHKISFEDVRALLPRTDHFEQWVDLWSEEPVKSINHTGMSFAIKLNTKLKPTYQFHFRFPYSERLGLPQKIKLNEKDLTYHQGISYEYTDDRWKQKKYYYIDDKQVSSYLKSLNEPALGQVIEYTETDQHSKIIHWIDDRDLCYDYFCSLNWPKMKEFVLSIKESFNCMPFFPGLYTDGSERSVYFLTPRQDTQHPFSLGNKEKIFTIENSGLF